jgi:hypothetical protein
VAAAVAPGLPTARPAPIPVQGGSGSASEWGATHASQPTPTVLPSGEAVWGHNKGEARATWRYLIDLVRQARLSRRVLAAGAGLVAVALIAVVAHAAVGAGTSKHTVTGTFVVQTVPDDGCGQQGWDATDKLDRLNSLLGGQTYACPDGPGGGYSDLHDGTTVSISGGSGSLLGTGALSGGIQDSNGVRFTFTVRDIPETDFYKVEVANRGTVPYSKQQMIKAKWSVATSVGG